MINRQTKKFSVVVTHTLNVLATQTFGPIAKERRDNNNKNIYTHIE